MRVLFLSFLTGFLLLSTNGCGPAPKPVATVSLSAEGLSGTDEIEIWDERKRIGSFQDPPLAAVGVVDSTGRFEGIVELDTAGPYWLMVRMKGTVRLFLHPGQQLQIAVDAADWSGTLSFSGDGAAEQLALDRLQTASWEDVPKGLDTLDAGEFTAAAIDFERRFRDRIEEEVAADGISDRFRRYVRAWADTRLYFTRANYEFAQERAGRTVILPDELFNREAILLRHRDLIADVPELRRLAEVPISDSVRKFIREDPPLDSDIEWQTAYKLRRIEEGPDDFRRPYLYASALVQYLSLGGTTPKADSVIALYADQLIPHDRAILDGIYATFKAMEDRPAPDFDFLLPDSTRMRLSDLRGSIVYIDVWATWCAPCLVEMPFSNDLRERYEERDDLVFLYVSVDDNTDAWYTMLKDRTDFGGLHGITGIGWDGPLTKEYRINGIPRTILVGRDGSLVRVSAPSPSSDEIVPLLDRLLG